jgi:hypothetical protein
MATVAVAAPVIAWGWEEPYGPLPWTASPRVSLVVTGVSAAATLPVLLWWLWQVWSDRCPMG